MNVHTLLSAERPHTGGTRGDGAYRRKIGGRRNRRGEQKGRSGKQNEAVEKRRGCGL